MTWKYGYPYVDCVAVCVEQLVLVCSHCAMARGWLPTEVLS